MKMTGVKLYNRAGDDSDFVEFDLKTDLLFIELSKKVLYKKLPHSIPDKTPIFYTIYGPLITIMSLQTFAVILKDVGYDFLNPSQLVNMRFVEAIVMGNYGGCEAILTDQQKISVSGPMQEKYSHLIKRPGKN